MSNYDYKVWRDGNDVFYSISRNGEIVTEREVFWAELGMFEAVILARPGSEKAIKRQLKLAHKFAKLAINAMEEFER